MIRNSPAWSVNIDAEITELNFRYKKVIADFIELGVELPLLSFNSGFMDGFLSSYHDALGFPDYGRSSRPGNKFLYELRKNGALIMEGDNGGTGIGDIRLTAKKVLLNNDPVVSLRAEVELPTGSASKGFGNGSVGAGIAILADKNVSKNVKTYANFGMIFPGDLRGRETLHLRNFFHGGAGVEAAFWKRTSLLAQVYVQDSPFPRTGISSIDRLSVLLSIGGRYSGEKTSFELSFTEDPNTSGAPDFSINISLKRKF